MQNKYELEHAFINPSPTNLGLFIAILEQTIFKKYTIKHLRKIGFKTSWKENELKDKHNCDIELAILFLKYLSKEENFEPNLARLTLADINPSLRYIDDSSKFDWILISTNTLPSFVYFKQAEKLFWQHELISQNKDVYQTSLLSVYALRLALESRIKGMLGILYAKRKLKNGWQDIRLESLLKIAKKLHHLHYHEQINWQEITHVNRWINAFVHTGIRPYPWLTYQAIKVIEPLFDSSPVETEGQIRHSLYSATQTASWETLKTEIDDLLVKEFEEVWIEWIKPEVMNMGKTSSET